MTRMPAGLEDVPRLPARGRLLLHQQHQGGLQPREARRDLGRLLQDAPLEEPRRRASRSSPSSTTSPRTKARSAQVRPAPSTITARRARPRLSSRHARGAPRLGAVLRQHHHHGRAGPASASTSSRRTAWPQDTIVFFYGDHGSGMPRSKRFPYDSGLHVLHRRRVPGEVPAPGAEGLRCRRARSNRLVGFVDLAPTVLSLAGRQAARFLPGAGVCAVPMRRRRALTPLASAAAWTSATT